MGWRRWSEVKKRLLGIGMLEVTNIETGPMEGLERPRGMKGCRAYGYRLKDPRYRHATFHLKPITNKALIENLHGYKSIRKPVQRWLRKNLEMVEIAKIPGKVLEEIAAREFAEEGTGSIDARVGAYREQIRWINEGFWIFRVDEFAGRIHTNLTQLKRELRAYLHVEGKGLVEIDIKNSQPLFIGLAARDGGVVEDERYLRLCEDDLYQYLADKGGWDRKTVKKQLTQMALFAPNNHHSQRSPVKKLFDAEFPAIADYIRRQKNGTATTNPKPWNRLAKVAQTMEAKFIIGGVCDRIRKESVDCWVSTIHDSILTQPESVDLVLGIIREEFTKLGVKPRLEAEVLSPNAQSGP